MNSIYLKIRVFKCTGACFLGTVSLGLFRTLVRVLSQFKSVQLSVSGVVIMCWHQLVGTVSESGGF